MFLGIDLGTSSLKAVLADENGKIVNSVLQSYPLLLPAPNMCEQHPEDWIYALKCVLKKMNVEYGLSKVIGLSFSGQMHGLVALDQNDAVLRPAILWNDQRTEKETDFLNDIIGKEKLLSYTGNIAVTGFTAPKILWMKEHEPLIFNKIKKIMLPKDYLAYKVSGIFATDVSDASGTLYFDVKNKQWSAPMLELLGIKKEQLPIIHESFDVIGTVKNDFAEETGLNKTCKIIIGAGDQAAGAVGTGTVKDGMLSLSLGTSGVIFAASDKYLCVENGKLHSFCHADAAYHLMGVTLCAAGSLAWWAETTGKKDFTELINECEKTESEVLFLPYLIGERSPINDPEAKGMFYGLSLGTKRAEMTKAVLEGVCFSLKDCFEAIKSSGFNAKEARAIGGGSKSELWLQLLSDILGIKISTVNTSDGGALGAVILAMVGCGKFSNVSEACEFLIKDEKIFLPDSGKTEIYAKKFEKYKKLYKLLQNF